MTSTKPLRKSLVGQRFGLLTVRQRAPNQGGRVIYECVCNCGEITFCESYNLHKGAIQSCGCRRRRTGNENPNWKGHGEIPKQYWTSIQNGASKRGLEFSATIQEMWDKFLEQGSKCAISGVPLVFAGYNSHKKQTASLDRIDSRKGYALDNLQWIHKDLQWMKGTFIQKDFLAWVETIARHLQDPSAKQSAPNTSESPQWCHPDNPTPEPCQETAKRKRVWER